MLSNAYFLAKFRFDTAENEPAKNLQKKLLILLTLTPNPNWVNLVGGLEAGLDRRPVGEGLRGKHERVPCVPGEPDRHEERDLRG